MEQKNEIKNVADFTNELKLKVVEKQEALLTCSYDELPQAFKAINEAVQEYCTWFTLYSKHVSK